MLGGRSAQALQHVARGLGIAEVIIEREGTDLVVGARLYYLPVQTKAKAKAV